MPTPTGPTLRIVSINDVYTLEHLPRLARLVEHHRTSEPADAFLSVIAGDFLAPSMLSSLDAGRGMVDCLDAVPIDVAIFGNHEDDVPVDELRRRIAEFRGTWLDTNVRFGGPEADPATRLPASRIVEVAHPGGRSVRVGLVGVVMNDPTIYRRLPFGATAIAPANESALAEARRLVDEERCGCVVAITHQPIDDDRALARTGRFAAILGGHEHAVFLEQVEGTWIVKAGEDALHAAVVELTFAATATANGGPESPTVSVRLDDTARYPEDPALRARVDGHMAKVHALEGATLIKLAPGERLSSVGTRAAQTTLGTLLCNQLRDAFDADACLFNGGGIRAQREYVERFTYGDLKAEVPFDNEIVVAMLPGRVLREAVAASRAHAPLESGAFLQVDDGVRVALPGHLVTHVAGAPLDEARDYRVATVRNLFGGMDHIEPLARFARERPERIPPPNSGREVKQALVHAFALALWRKLGGFDAVDANHDGRVDATEIAQAVARVTDEPASPITVGLLLEAVDGDHDREVSRGEAELAAGPGPRRPT